MATFNNSKDRYDTGNNIYGKDVASKLSQLKAQGGDGLAAYILMQRIFPAEHVSYLVRGGAWSPNKTISELGIYGAYLRSGLCLLLCQCEAAGQAKFVEGSSSYIYHRYDCADMETGRC